MIPKHFFKTTYLSNGYLVIVGIVLSFTLKAQQYNFKNYSAENGLPYVQIFTLFQDSKGYLWSGGYGGLSKFNGKEFKNYSPKNGLANHYVNAIIENKNHLMVVGTIDGLSVIDANHIRSYYMKDGLPSNHITAFSLDKTGLLWIGTKKGLCIYDHNNVKQIPFFKNYTITSLLYSYENGLLIGTTRGLFRQSMASPAEFTQLLDSVNVSCIAECPLTKKIYTGTTEGLYFTDLDTRKSNIFHVSNGLIDEDITAVVCQKNGTTWIGSKSGLVSFDGKEFSYFTISLDNNANHIRSLIIDYESNLWIGTHSGLYKYRGKGFTTYGKQDGLGGAFIYQIIGDKADNMWVTTEANGVYKYAEGFFKNYSEKDGLIGNHAQCAICLDDGSVWIGTDRGISKIKGDHIENLVYGKHFKLKPPINCFYEDSKKQLWIGGTGGLCCMVENANHTYTTIYYTLPAPDKDYTVWSVLEDKQGFIWAGTYLAGFYKLEGGQFLNQKNQLGMEVESAIDLDGDDYGNIYAATLNGVLVINTMTGSTKLISEKDGLSSELVYSLKVTKNKKYLWVGTNQGISKIDLPKLNSNIIDIVSYSKADGFEGVECNSHGIYEDPGNNVWFGTVNGLVKYTPSEFVENDNPSKTTIAGIKLSYTDTLLADGSVLPYDFNNISFYVDGICLTNPDKVLYSYKLEGFESKWSPATPINFAKYDNLPAGQYTFNVKSSNNEGIWNLEPTTFTFVIKPAFYKTWWFVLALLALTLGFIIAVFRIRLNQLNKKQKEKFDQEVEISKAELKALRAQMNPHFIFNSLNSIQHYILNSKSEEAVKYLNKFAKLIRLILNNSDKPMVTINEDLESLTLYLELEKMRFDHKFDYTIDIHESIDGDYDEIPPMLVQPYIENAILHGINPKEGTGTITIEILLVSQFIKISISDDGIGRNKSRSLQSLQPKNRHKSLGMRITKDRVRILNTMHQSNLNVNITDLYNDKKEPIGTRVDIYIPYIK